MRCSCCTVLLKIRSRAALEMKIWVMLTDGARTQEGVGGYSPLLWLKAFVCPCHRSLQCRATAAAQPLQLPACLSTAPHPANTGYLDQGGGLFRIQPLLLAVCTPAALGCTGLTRLWARWLRCSLEHHRPRTATSCCGKGLPAWRTTGRQGLHFGQVVQELAVTVNH